MRLIFQSIYLLFFLGSPATALGYFSFEGNYSFQGEFSPIQVIQNESVFLDTSSGRTRLESLRSQGFVCAEVGYDHQHCSRYVKLDILPTIIQKRIEKRLTEFKLSIGSLAGPILNLYRGKNYSEWYVPASVRWGNSNFDFYRLHWFDGEYEISFGEYGSAEYTSLVVSKNSFFALIQEVLRESNSRWTQFVVLAHIESE